MKPSNRERAALGRRPISPEHHRYEELKRRWQAEHPLATAEEHARAMQGIAKRCGI